MKKDERRKAIATAVAMASGPLGAMLPSQIRTGLAAMAEELTELDLRLARLELLAGVERAFAKGVSA